MCKRRQSIYFIYLLRFAFSALTLLAGRQDEHPASKNWVTGCWCGCLSWSEVQIVCMWSSWCHCHSKTPSSLASFKSRVMVLPFWYQLTQIVLETRPLNGCSSSSLFIMTSYTRYKVTRLRRGRFCPRELSWQIDTCSVHDKFLQIKKVMKIGSVFALKI